MLVGVTQPELAGSPWAREPGPPRRHACPALDLAVHTAGRRRRAHPRGRRPAGRRPRRRHRRPRRGPGRDGGALRRRGATWPASPTPPSCSRETPVPGRALRRRPTGSPRSRTCAPRPASRPAGIGVAGGDRLSVKGLLDVPLAEVGGRVARPAPDRARRRHRPGLGRGTGRRGPHRSRAGGPIRWPGERAGRWWDTRSRHPRGRPRRRRRPTTTRPKEACGVFGVYAPGQPVAHLTYLGLYALQHRGPGVGRHGGQRRRDHHRRQGHGPRVQRVRRPHAGRARPATSPSATPATRTTGSSTWRNAQPVYRDVAAHTVRPRPQRQPRQHRGARRPRPGMLPGMVTSDSDLMAELIARELGRDPETSADGRALERALLEVLPRSRAPSRSCSWTRATSSACATRTASGRCASASSTTAGCSPRRARRSTSSAPTSSASSSPGEMVIIDANGVPLGAAVRRRSGRPEALPVRVRLLRPPRHPPLRPERPPGPGAHGRAARRAGAGRGRPGDGRARVGHPRGRGLRPRAAASPSARASSRTATSAARSSRPTRRCGRSACA